MKKSVIDKIVAEKIVVIVRGVEKDKLIPLAEAMYDGGIRLLEITYDARDPGSDTETAEKIELLADEFEGRMLIGAGTVLTERQVELTVGAGGKFIISPDANPDIIKKTCECGLVSIPGALTPTEAVAAYNAGADFIKLFPITNMGSDYVKAVKAPLSHIKFLAVGGVDLSNMKEYLDAGISGFGIGSNIVDKKLIASGEYGKITELARKYTELVD